MTGVGMDDRERQGFHLSLWETLWATLWARLYVSPGSPHSAYSALSHCHHRPLTADCSSSLSQISFISEMSQSSSSSPFQALFNAAVDDYKDKTGTSLIDHPFAQQLESCESVSSITSILQKQAQSFREFNENDGKLMKALNSSVEVLCAPSINSALKEGIGLVVRPKEFIQVACS